MKSRQTSEPDVQAVKRSTLRLRPLQTRRITKLQRLRLRVGLYSRLLNRTSQAACLQSRRQRNHPSLEHNDRPSPKRSQHPHLDPTRTTPLTLLGCQSQSRRCETRRTCTHRRNMLNTSTAHTILCSAISHRNTDHSSPTPTTSSNSSTSSLLIIRRQLVTSLKARRCRIRTVPPNTCNRPCRLRLLAVLISSSNNTSLQTTRHDILLTLGMIIERTQDRRSITAIHQLRFMALWIERRLCLLTPSHLLSSSTCRHRNRPHTRIRTAATARTTLTGMRRISTRSHRATTNRRNSMPNTLLRSTPAMLCLTSTSRRLLTTITTTCLHTTLRLHRTDTTSVPRHLGWHYTCAVSLRLSS